MPLRRAELKDVERIAELGSLSLKDGPYAGIIEDSRGHGERLAREIIEKGEILVGEQEGEIVGLLGFIVANHHFSGQCYAAELMWYVLPEKRKGGIALELLWQAEKDAKQMGAECFCFTAPNESVEALYQRFGYKKLEVTYRKVL